MRRTWTRNASLVAAAAAIAGCNPLGTGGELSNGSFAYQCTAGGDATCEEAFLSINEVTFMPDAIAVGGRFGVVYEGEEPETEDGVSFSVRIVPASPLFIETIGNTDFRATGAGNIALLARGANGVVADFLHIRAADVHAIDVTKNDDLGGGAVTEIALGTAENAALQALPKDVDGATLSGGLTYTWTTSDSAIVAVSAATGDNDATLTGVAPGTAKVTITSGDALAEIAVTVGGGL